MGLSGDRLGAMLGHLVPSWSDLWPLRAMLGRSLGSPWTFGGHHGTMRGGITNHAKTIGFSRILAFWASSEGVFRIH